MYQLDWFQRLRTVKSSAAYLPNQQTGVRYVAANVWRLGFTSLFTDISSEMVSSIFPLYFVSYLQFSPFEFGVLDGIYQGAAVAVLSLAAGLLADRWSKPKEIAAAGYAFSAVSKLALLVAGSRWGLAAGSLALDRLGKGIRTAPRDAIISQSSSSSNLATSFAVHRGLDAGGAVLGPLAAFALLRMTPGGFPLVMMASFCIAVIGVGLITLLVDKRPAISFKNRSLFDNLQLPLRLLSQPAFRILFVVGALIELATVSDGFLYLSLQRKTGAPGTVFPLFAFLTAAVYALLSLPAGRLADRWGRRNVFLAGSGLLIGVYLLLLLPVSGSHLPYLILVVLGAYYAATDGVLAAMGSSILPPEVRASGLALLNTAVSLARFVSSFLFGLLWQSKGSEPPIWIFLGGIIPALCISAHILFNSRHSAPGES